MEPLRLYQFSFSHFCDKVRWALDYKNIPYTVVPYHVREPTEGLEHAPQTLQKLVPIIEDPNNRLHEDNTSFFISDSTPILLYLEERYPDKKSLFPVPSSKQAIIDYCLILDSTLGLFARRLAYLQVFSEKPAILSINIMPLGDQTQSVDNVESKIKGTIVCCFLISRYRVHRVKEDQIVENTQKFLRETNEKLMGKQYLFDNQFTAADLTLCALMKPLLSIPSFYPEQKEKYRRLFDYHDRVRKEYDLKCQDSVIERLLKREREVTAPQRSKVKVFIKNAFYYLYFILLYPLAWLIFRCENNEAIPLEFSSSLSISTSKITKAQNDQRSTGSVSQVGLLIKSFLHFYYTIPKQMKYMRRVTRNTPNS